MFLRQTCRGCEGDGMLGSGQVPCPACYGSGIIESEIDFDGPSIQDVLDKCEDIKEKVDEIHTIVSGS